VWRASTGDIHRVFDQIPNIKNCFTTPNKNLGGVGPQADKHLPPSPFPGQFLRKADIWDWIKLLIWSMRKAKEENGA
jgi:hypothetical protein